MMLTSPRERGRRRALTPDAFAYTTPYNRYRLTLRKLPDGAIAREVLLGESFAT